jgi:hypothetical protein
MELKLAANFKEKSFTSISILLFIRALNFSQARVTAITEATGS